MCENSVKEFLVQINSKIRLKKKKKFLKCIFSYIFTSLGCLDSLHMTGCFSWLWSCFTRWAKVEWNEIPVNQTLRQLGVTTSLLCLTGHAKSQHSGRSWQNYSKTHWGGGESNIHTLTVTVTTSFTHFYTQLYIGVKKYLQKQTGITDWFTPRALSQIQSSDTSVNSDLDLIKKKSNSKIL